nr:RGG repeats nuclear RNA binding protein A-like isoform X2 [Lolium perenne]
MATTLNPFDLLGDDEGEDPAQLLAKAAALAQKAEAKKSAPAAAAAGKPAAKLPTKPAPPAQAVQESRGGSRGGFRQGERGYGRGGRGGYGQNRDFGGEDTNGYRGGGYGARTGGEEGGERGPRPPYQGARRGGYREGEFGDDSERPPRRNYERHSGTGRGYEMKRDGAGRGNWGTASDELAQETEALKLDEKAPVAEKLGAPEDGPQAEENKVSKDATANVEEEKEEEDKEMTLEEFEKVMEEKRKALLALKRSEERKVEIDKDLQAMQLLCTKKGNDEVFIKLGADKDALKKKENAEREERAKKSVSINEFLKPAEGERYYGGRGRGSRGRGDRGGFRGGFGGSYHAPPAAPGIQDKNQFPTLGGK